MNNQQALTLVRTIHTVIYIVMATATFVLLYAGITGAQGIWLWVALVLLTIESVVFLSNGMRCPLTDLATKYGATSGYVFDTFLPEQYARYTFRFFGSVMVVSLLLLMLRWLGVIGSP
jgi:hypothetical protein